MMDKLLNTGFLSIVQELATRGWASARARTHSQTRFRIHECWKLANPPNIDIDFFTITIISHAMYMTKQKSHEF
jgi:hypothetical protein